MAFRNDSSSHMLKSQISKYLVGVEENDLIVLNCKKLLLSSTGKEVQAAQSDSDILGQYGQILGPYGRIFFTALLSVIAGQ